MKHVRAAWRLLLFAAATAFFYLGWLTGGALSTPFPAARRRWRNATFRHWSRTVLRVLRIRVAQRGTPPRAPFFLVANHLSYLDVLVLASRLDAVFVAKSEVAEWPIMGRLCRSIETLFVDRSSARDLPRVTAAIDAVLDSGQGIVLFPEGTSTAGAGVGPFRPSLLAAAARRSLPVSYAALTYRTERAAPPARLALCWWGEMEFAGHFWNLLGLPRAAAQVAFGAHSIVDRDRKRLAARLRGAVVDLFVPVDSAAPRVEGDGRR